MKKFLKLSKHFFLTFSLFTVIHSPVIADKQGAILVKNHCAECHGVDGNGVSDNKNTIPKIAGFSAFFIYDTLIQFQQGDRKGKKIKNNKNQETDMNEVSKKLSDEDAETIALYLSKQTFKPAKQPSNLTLVVQGKQIHQDLCNDCHGEDGTSVADDAPILAGQWTDYLQHQFIKIAKFERVIPRKMRRKFKKLSDQDITALLAFYAHSSSQ